MRSPLVLPASNSLGYPLGGLGHRAIDSRFMNPSVIAPGQRDAWFVRLCLARGATAAHRETDERGVFVHDVPPLFPETNASHPDHRVTHASAWGQWCARMWRDEATA